MEKDKKPHFKPRRRHAGTEGVRGEVQRGGGATLAAKRERERKKIIINKITQQNKKATTSH